MELRCDSRILHGIVVDGTFVETTCKSRWCGKRQGVVVLHRFNIHTGEFTTQLFAEPPEERSSNGASVKGAAVRSAGD